jgi:hypothetical protein
MAISWLQGLLALEKLFWVGLWLKWQFFVLKPMSYEELFRFYNNGGNLTCCAEPS